MNNYAQIYSTVTDENLKRAFETSPTVLYDHGAVLADVFSLIIKTAGQFCERFASDCIYDINQIKEDAETIAENDTKYYVLGFRKHGVDSMLLVQTRLSGANSTTFYQTRDSYYRKIYGIKMTRQQDEISCEIKDIQSNIALEMTDLETYDKIRQEWKG